MALSFTAFDIETASPKWESICSIGLVKVRDGIIVDSMNTYIDPECDFHPKNIQVHGITPLMVAGAPRFNDIADEIIRFIGDDILISHNIVFDAHALQRAFNRYSLKLPAIRTFCTLAYSRIADPDLASHMLPIVCKRYNVSLKDHHDAAADAEACAEIMIGMAEKMNVETLEEAASSLKFTFGHIDNDSVVSPYSSYSVSREIRKKNNAQRAENPFTLFDDVRSACPEYANEFEMSQSADGSTVTYKISDNVLFYQRSAGSFLRCANFDDIGKTSPRSSIYKDGSVKLPLGSDFDYEQFLALIADRARTLYSQAAADRFACCNDFNRCSDEKRCIKANDPEYRGCLYRKNLEAGRIFYGKNRNA